MGSTRLPGKALTPLAGVTLLERCIRRLQAADIGPVIVATTTRDDDSPLAERAEALGARVVRGPVEDVLQRFLLVADYLDARFFIRATGDNPLVDIDAPRRVAEAIVGRDADHVVEADLPLGAAVEAVRTAALYQAAAQTMEAYDREHVTPFLYRTPSRFVAVRLPAPAALRRPDLRVTIDTPADLAFAEHLLQRLAGEGVLVPLASIISAADDMGRHAG